MRITLRPFADEVGGWLAEVPNLPGCMSDADGPRQRWMRIARWLAAAKEDEPGMPQSIGADVA